MTPRARTSAIILIVEFEKWKFPRLLQRKVGMRSVTDAFVVVRLLLTSLSYFVGGSTIYYAVLLSV